MCNMHVLFFYLHVLFGLVTRLVFVFVSVRIYHNNNCRWSYFMFLCVCVCVCVCGLQIVQPLAEVFIVTAQSVLTNDIDSVALIAASVPMSGSEDYKRLYTLRRLMKPNEEVTVSFFGD